MASAGLLACPSPAVSYFTSNLRAADQLPGEPELSLARTRHHMRVLGSVLVVNCETDSVWVAVSALEKLDESSI